MRRSTRAAALLVACVLAAACSGGDDEVPPAASADDAPLRSTTTTAPPVPTLERVSADPAVFGGRGDQRLTAVATGTDRLVALGTSDGRPAVWVSLDGLAWDAVALSAAEVPDAARLADVAAAPAGFVAVGRDVDKAAAWTSLDGRSWERAHVEPGRSMTLVADSRVGLLAFGDDAAEGDGAASWYSVDGRYWERAPAVADVSGGQPATRPGPARVVGVGDTGDGVIALVDRAGQGAEVWTSRDAASWRVGPVVGAGLLPVDGVPRPSALATLGSTVAVVGSVARPDGVDAAVWTATSPGGWEGVDHDEAVFGGDGAQEMVAVVPLGGGLLAAGTETSDGGDVDAVVWTSSDGGRWRRAGETETLARAGDEHVTDATSAGDRVVAVGWQTGAEGTDAVVWTLGTVDAEPPVEPEGPVMTWQRVAHQPAFGGVGEQRMAAVAATVEGFVAVGATAGEDEQGLDGAVWTSTDGAEWILLDDDLGALGGPGDQELLAVAVAGPSAVAVGRDGSSAAVWASSGGGSWERVPHVESVFGGLGDQVAAGVAVAVDGLIAVGSDSGGDGGGDAAVWSSPDGTSWSRVPVDAGLGGSGRQAMSAVAASGAGILAAGVDGDRAAGWWSPDGSTWAREELGPGEAGAVVVIGDGGIAAGSTPGEDGSTDAAVWALSAGGWERRPGGDLSGADRLEGSSVAVGDAVTILVGSVDDGRGVDAAAWASPDGIAWTRTPHDENVFGGDQAQHMVAVAVREGTAVAVGWTGTAPGDRDAAVWITAQAGGGASPL